MSDQEIKERFEKAQKLLKNWATKQGHDRCWYYPDIFKELLHVMSVEVSVDPQLPSLKEFKEGCQKYQNEQYESSNNG